MARALVPHSSHWGAFEAEVADGTVVAIRPYRHDPDPSPLLGNIVDSLRHRARITQPMIRAGWLDRGPGPDARRGAEPFVPVSWATAIDLLARELRRVYDRYGGRERLRRLVRLEQRRPLPPRAEPAPPLPQLPRRLRPRRAHLQQRRAVGDHAARRRLDARVPGPGDGVVGARAAHRALRLLRRHPDQEHDGEPRRRQPAPGARPPARGAGARRRVRAAEPAARRPARVRRRRMAPRRAGHRRRRHARARATRSSTRDWHDRAFLDALLRRIRPLRALSARRGRRLPEDAGVGRAPLRDSRRDDPRARPADGREAHADQRELLAPARRARRAGAVARGDAGVDARPDRAAGRRLRPGLRLARLHRPGAPARGSADAAAGARTPCARSSPSPAWRTCCSIRASRSTSTASASPIPRSASCTGAAATPSITTRTSRGCAGRSPGRRRSSSTIRSGRRWRATPTSCCRRR